jgi:hypothetical protein
MSQQMLPAYGPVAYEFAPSDGAELAAVGEWIMDYTGGENRNPANNEGFDNAGNPRISGGKTEIHETWMYAARDLEHLLPDGGVHIPGPQLLQPTMFGKALDYRISAQLPTSAIETLWLQVLVPPRPASESNLAKFECHTLQQTAGGCPGAHPDVNIDTEGEENMRPDGGFITFVVSLPNTPGSRAALTTPYDCSNYQCGGNCRTYTCFNEQVALHGSCNIPVGGKPLIAGVVRCSWVDPLDLWSCSNCAGRNPAPPGTPITAPVVGCASIGLDPNRPEDRATACNEVCGGLVCGDAPACRISQLLPPASGAAPDAKLLARLACPGPAPFNRVAPMGDYRVDFGPGSSLRFGEVDSSGSVASFVEFAKTSATGFAYLNPAGSTLQLAYLEVHGVPFKYTTLEEHSVTEMSAFTLVRGRAGAHAPGSTAYEFNPGTLLIAARASIDGDPIGAELVNQGPATAIFNSDTGTFTLDSLGRDDKGQAVKVHLVGTVTNRPPVARVALTGDVECTSHQTTPVTLSSVGSSDPDPGDRLTHYQWFKEELHLEPGTLDQYVPVTWGIGSGPTVTTEALLGEHTWWLHTYDTHLGSSKALASVRVVDTTPPTLSVAEPVCLWPPNHDWARFSLSDLVLSVADTCDPAPRLRIVSVSSSEAVDATGSGNTAPDVVFGATTACVRSERAGPGTGRSYVMVVEARDASGNAATRRFTVEVPHDMSGKPGCLRVAGVDAPTVECQQ